MFTYGQILFLKNAFTPLLPWCPLPWCLLALLSHFNEDTSTPPLMPYIPSHPIPSIQQRYMGPSCQEGCVKEPVPFQRDHRRRASFTITVNTAYTYSQTHAGDERKRMEKEKRKGTRNGHFLSCQSCSCLIVSTVGFWEGKGGEIFKGVWVSGSEDLSEASAALGVSSDSGPVLGQMWAKANESPGDRPRMGRVMPCQEPLICLLSWRINALSTWRRWVPCQVIGERLSLARSNCLVSITSLESVSFYLKSFSRGSFSAETLWEEPN